MEVFVEAFLEVNFMEASMKAFVEVSHLFLEVSSTKVLVEALLKDFVKVASTEAFVEAIFMGTFLKVTSMHSFVETFLGVTSM